MSDAVDGVGESVGDDVTVFHNVQQIQMYGSFKVGDNGTIVTDETEIKQNGTVLQIGSRNSSGSGTCSINNYWSGSSMVTTGNQTMHLNGIKVVSGQQSISLTGPPTTRLIVNGVATTFAQLSAAVSATTASAGNTVAQKPKKVYRLADDCRIRDLSVQGGGECDVAARFYDGSLLYVSIQGSADVILPPKTFQALNISIAGSGDVIGNGTRAESISVTIAGSGDVKDLTALDNGAITVAGSGDVSIDAVNPSRVVKNVLGSGRVRIRPVGVDVSQQQRQPGKRARSQQIDLTD